MHTLRIIQNEIEEDDKLVKHEKEVMDEDEIHQEMHSWISDMRNSSTRDTKYFQTVLLYRHMKFVLGKAMLNHTEERKEILLQLDEP